jgi:hypothetical protein
LTWSITFFINNCSSIASTNTNTNTNTNRFI